MVDCYTDSKTRITRIRLAPNNSLSWRGNLYFIVSIAALAAFIAIGFLLLGAWVILPFSGLEVAAVSLSFYWLARQNRRQQLITFTDDQVTIEKGIEQPQQCWHYQRAWSAFHVKRDQKGWYSPSITISSKGNSTEVGEFLNRRDKIKLVNTLKKVVNTPCYINQS